MCEGGCCCCGPRRHHGHHGMGMGYHLPLMDVDEEIKMLEEYKEALAKRLEKVNKRIEALKR
jgi:prefoldin subunit 5